MSHPPVSCGPAGPRAASVDGAGVVRGDMAAQLGKLNANIEKLVAHEDRKAAAQGRNAAPMVNPPAPRGR